MNHQNRPVSKAIKASFAILTSPFTLLKGLNEVKREQVAKENRPQPLTHPEWLKRFPEALQSPAAWKESHIKWQKHLATFD
jgi:hypothetical protein